MDLRPLQTDRPSPGVRALLIGEVALFLGVVALYMWVGLPTNGSVRAVDVAAYVFAGAFPIVMNLMHGDRPGDSGFRLDNLVGSLKEVGSATAAMGAGVVVVAAVLGSFHWDRPIDVAEHVGGYLGWGLVQQYWMQAFCLRRLRHAGLPRSMLVPVAAGLFALMHAPNWPLVLLTGGAALAWCSLFLRKPNLLTLAASHAVLAVLVRYSLPNAWLHRLTVGGIYLDRVFGG